MLTHTIDLVYNLCLLIALSVVSGFIRQRRERRAMQAAFQGLLFGSATVIGMMRPWGVAPGLIFDGRSVMLSLCGLFFGPVAVAVAAAMAMLYRIFLGGIGAPLGLVIIAVSASLGLLFHRRWVRAGLEITVRKLLGLALLLHLAITVLVFILPAGAAVAALRRMALPTLLAYPLATLLIGKVLSSHAMEFRSLQALREREERYHAFFTHGPDAIVVLDPVAMRPIEFNDQACRQLGYTREEFGRLTMQDIEAFESTEDTSRRIHQIMAKGHGDFETAQRTKQGELRTIHVTAQFIQTGGCSTYHCVWRDITERRREEHELRRMNRLYSLLSQLGLCLVRVQNREDLLQEFCTIAVKTGHYPLVSVIWLDPVSGQATSVAQAGDGLEFMEDTLFLEQNGSAALAPAVTCIREDRRLVRQYPTGTGGMKSWHPGASSLGLNALAAFPIHLHKQAVASLMVYARETEAFQDKEIELLGKAASDISFGLERFESEGKNTELQAQLLHAQKMESLGTLAGGIAHDMNNVLAAIVAVTQTVRSREGNSPDLDHALGIVEKASTRGRDLVKGLMDFTRKDLATRTSLDLNDLVRNEMALLERTLQQKYSLVMDLEEPLPAVMGESGLLGSALMNLCVNAVDAMATGGTLTIRTRRVEKGFVQITVEDTGVGMAPEILKKAMEPFFTTKAPGKGTGLGLAMVFNAARAHGGTLTLQSQEGRGTQVLLRLPCLTTGALPSLDPEAAPAQKTGLNILMVDDDELLRAAIPNMLQVLGHRVEAVDGGKTALACLERGPVPDLVILDMNMPEMTGMETLSRIRVGHPALPVLLATGYLDPGLQAAIEAAPRTMAITKPFSLEEIRRKLGEFQLEG